MRSIITFLFALVICLHSSNAQNIDAVTNALKTDRQKADTIYSIAMKYFGKSMLDSSGYILGKGMAFAEKTGDNELIARYIIQQSYVPYFSERFEEALAILKGSYPHLKFSPSSQIHNKYLLLLGRCYENLNRNDSALYYYNQSELLNAQHNPYDNWLVYYDMAQMFKRTDAFDKSEIYFTKAYELTKAKGIKKDRLVVLIEFADLYYQLGKPYKFAPLMDEQQEIMTELEKTYPNMQAHIMYFIDREKEPLEKKVLFMENVKQELMKGGNIEKGALANKIIAGIYEKAHQPTKALTYIDENIRLFENENDILGLYSNEKIANRLLKNAGLAKEATSTADRLFILKDSIIAIQQRRLVMELQTKYETEKKDRNIDLLKSENDLNAVRLAKTMELKEALARENILKDSVVMAEKAYNKLLAHENTLRSSKIASEQILKNALIRENELKGNQIRSDIRIRMFLIGGGLLLLFCALVIFFLYRNQKSKNLLIQKQADDLQMLMREIHHRVKNNLQVISSLLDLQSLTIKDRHASEAIKESRNRVYSMALIHQNLYKEENVIGIEMNDYVNKLVQSLFESYNVGEGKIALETDIDPLLLDVDMVIPIGLVLNELVSNSLKYAFGKGRNGALFISLKKLESEMLLKVRDNGDGFPEGMDFSKTSSFGYKLVKAFSQKLKARLEVYNDNGACILLHIKKIKYALA